MTDAGHDITNPWHWALLAVATVTLVVWMLLAHCGPLSCPMPELIGPPLPPDYVARRAGLDVFFLHDPLHRPTEAE